MEKTIKEQIKELEIKKEAARIEFIKTGNKKFRHEMNQIALMINKLDGTANNKSPRRKTDKYSTFREVPNKDGIRKVTSGGKCSPK